MADDKGIANFFGTMESATRIAAARGLKYVEDELAAGREVVFRKPETIDLIKKSSLYEYVDLPDGSVKVIKVNQDAKDIFEGKAPSSSTPPSLPEKPGKASKSAKSFSDIAKSSAVASAEIPDFMTYDQTRRLLGVSDGELESLIRSETLKPDEVELEGKVQQVFPKSSVEEYRKTIASAKPVVEASSAKPDSVSETIRKLNEAADKTVEPKKPLELPKYTPKRMVRLQSGELVDISLSDGKKLFEAERDAEVKAIAQRESAVNQIIKNIREKQRKVPLTERTGRVVGHAFKGRGRQGYKSPLRRYGTQFYKNIGGMRGGLMGLGALAGGALIGKMIQGSGELREAQEREQEMLRRRARQDMLDLLGRKEQKQAVQMNINQNLAKLQMEAPDLYMRVATGRVLPQGAVVIGGAPRADLLNQLGMAMANGQFGQ